METPTDQCVSYRCMDCHRESHSDDNVIDRCERCGSPDVERQGFGHRKVITRSEAQAEMEKSGLENLIRYHQILWSKPLPNGLRFDLDDNTPRLLHHKSELGEFLLSSDAIGHTYSRVKSMSHIADQVPSEEINSFFSACSMIGAYIIFPSKQIDKKMTINASRGLNRSIKDRFDLTLECIRRFYINETSPLTDTFQRYSHFFSLFRDFKGYTDFFLLQDLVEENDSSVKFFLPFRGFDQPPLPSNVEEYQAYKKHLMDFLRARDQRMLSATSEHHLQS